MSERSNSIVLRSPPHVSLIGLPGVGKSTVGRRLAGRLGVTFSDSDALIEKRLGVSIRDFFEVEGEQRFREVESAVLDEITAGAETVIATGGGVVLRAENRRMLRERTVCIYLKTPPDVLFHRLRRDTRRPLLQVADPAGRLRELSDERDPLYSEAASFEIETRGKSLNMLVDIIVRRLAAVPTTAQGRVLR